MKHILIVDDDAFLLELMSKKLQKEGYQVTTAIDGKAALSILQQEAIDVAICDLKMPLMDGYELNEHVHKSEQLQDIPMVFLTDNPELLDIAHEKLKGARAILLKPLADVDLYQTIERVTLS